MIGHLFGAGGPGAARLRKQGTGRRNAARAKQDTDNERGDRAMTAGRTRR